MEQYKLYDLRNKRDYISCTDWWELMRYIKKHSLECNLSKNIHHDEWIYGPDLTVMTSLNIKVSSEEARRSLKTLPAPNNTKAKGGYYANTTIHPEAEYGLPFVKGRGSQLYRYRQTECGGGSGRWVRRSGYRRPKMNKKYWADLYEYGISPIKEDWNSPWYDDYDYRSTSRSWKHNTKKKKQWM